MLAVAFYIDEAGTPVSLGTAGVSEAGGSDGGNTGDIAGDSDNRMARYQEFMKI